jgi:hypothetical protein
MNLDLYIDLEARRLVAGPNDASTPKLPPFTQGDTLSLRLHFLEDNGAFGYREIRPDFSALKVGIGWIDRPAASGTWRLACDGAETADLSHAATKAAVATALNGLASVTTRGGVTVEAGGASNIYQVRWNNRDLGPEDAVLTVEENRLAPKCFSRVLRYETDRGWLHLVKVFRAPIAFTDQFLFPAPPAVTCAVARAGTGARNAVVALTVPDGAAGSLELVWGGRSTVILPVVTLTAAALANALNDLYTDGVTRFAATQPRRGVFYIEFVGPLGLAEQSAPTVALHDQESLPSPVGSLALDGPGVEMALDGAASVRGLVLEAEMTTADQSGTLFQQAITVFNDMIDAPMALAADPAWLEELQKPTATVDYDPDQAVIGMLGYQDFAGDAVATAWTYTHNLDTLNVHITVRDNVSGLRVPDNTYTAAILNQNQVRITFPEAPAEDQFVVIISAANAEPHFQPHTHGIPEVDGLQAALDALSAAGNPLELWPVIPLDKLPMIPAAKILPPLTDAHIPANIPRLDADGFIPLSVIPPEVPRLNPDGSVTAASRTGATLDLLAAGGLLNPTLLGDLARVPGFVDAVKTVLSGGGYSAGAMTFTLPSGGELYPGRAKPPADVTALDTATLPRPGGLLPAVHTNLMEVLPEPLPEASASFAGRVFFNDGAAAVDLPGGYGRRTSSLAVGAYAACDGRVWYPVRRDGTSTSYYPADFERELCLLDINAEMTPVGSTLLLDVTFETQVIRSDSRCQWVLLVELGTWAGEAAPAGTNISGITWATTPLIRLPLRLTPIRTPHSFGVRVVRDAEGDLTTQTRLYRAPWASNEAGPASPGFVLRARLAHFDTEDNLTDPHGYVLLRLNPESKSIATIS